MSQADSPVAVTAMLTARPGFEARAAELIAGIVAATQRHAGMLRYEAQQQLDAPRNFTFIEQWTSREALDAHLATPELLAFREAAAEVFEGPSDVRLWRLVK